MSPIVNEENGSDPRLEKFFGAAKAWARCRVYNGTFCDDAEAGRRQKRVLFSVDANANVVARTRGKPLLAVSAPFAASF
jgi:hypothetical protein